MRAAQPYARQHYVPQFLLRQWHTAPDDKLTVHQRLRGVFLHKRATANQVGFARHLYSIPRPGGHMDTTIERDFMGPYVDGPAAQAHKVILAHGVKALDPEQRGNWAQFMVSLLLRVPRVMAVIHERAVNALGAQLDAEPDYARQFDPSATTTRQWVEEHYPEAYAEVAVRVLPQLIQSKRLLSEMTKGHWATRTLAPSCPYTLLIGDHPLLYVGSVEAGAFLIVIPLAPRCAFIYFGNEGTWDNLRRESDAAFAKRVNLETTTSAARYVFAADDRHAAFIAKHLTGVAAP